MLFALYLVLVAAPRFDESNIIETNLTREACEEASGLANGAHHAMDPEASSRYIWACGPQPPEIDHHEDMLRNVHDPRP
jgi:hypothetical protein